MIYLMRFEEDPRIIWERASAIQAVRKSTTWGVFRRSIEWCGKSEARPSEVLSIRSFCRCCAISGHTWRHIRHGPRCPNRPMAGAGQRRGGRLRCRSIGATPALDRLLAVQARREADLVRGRPPMRMFPCEQDLMQRALHPRWPYRRSHCRHDLHWLVRVRPRRRWCAAWRRHHVACLPSPSRRPPLS